MKNRPNTLHPQSIFLSNSLQQLFSKELTDCACQEGRFRVIFLPLQKTVPQVCLAIQQDRRRTGKKVKQGSREERKNCQIKTPRKQISQYQDLQKKRSISITTREGQDTMVTQALQQGLFQKQVLDYFKCRTEKVYAYFLMH